eukprot:Phypoly_transcript_12101.p1 GENE.Phypoly_transcript_12101~~Phypoly_transcript_12101.p1  ORF type:complete len:288 (+),score=35.48 Phypoly_transcript_12101:155-1018(+)
MPGPGGQDLFIIDHHALNFLELLSLVFHSETRSEDPLLAQFHLPKKDDAHFHENTTGLTLTDKYLILLLRPDGEHLNWDYVTCALATTIFGELLLRGIIHLGEKKKHRTINMHHDYEWNFASAITRPIDSELLEEAVQLMTGKYQKEMAVWWTRTLTNHIALTKGIQWLHDRCLLAAAQNHLIDQDKKTHLKIFKSKYYHVHDPALQQKLIQTVREFALENKIPTNIHDYALVAFFASHAHHKYNQEQMVDLHFIFPDKNELQIAKNNMAAFCDKMNCTKLTTSWLV